MFEAVLPSGWTFKSVDRGDYGIDGEVEVFEGGVTTGLTFKVQLKGTDAARGGPSVRVRSDHLLYWASLDVPVLLVLYSSRPGALHGRWTAGVGADRVGAGRSAAPDRVTVAFAPEHLLDRAAAGELAGQVRLLRDLKRGKFPRPVPLTLGVTAPPGARLTRDGLRAAVWRLDTARSVVRAARAGEPAVAIDVDTTAGTVRAALPLGFGTGTYRVAGGYPDAAVGVTLAGDVLVLVALLLARLGRSADAADVAVLGGPRSSLLTNPEVAGEIGQVFADERRARDAWTLARPLLEAGAADILGPTCSWSRCRCGWTCCRTTTSGVLRGLRQAQAEALGERPGAATAWYNLAHLLGRRGLMAEAGTAMDRAGALDPAYPDRAYYQRELGGSLFLAGRYDDAVDAYGRALVAGGEEARVVPLLGDALFRAGRYARSVEVLAGHRPSGLPGDRLAALTGLAAEFVVRTTGLDEQRRRPLTDEELEGLRAAADGGERELGRGLLRDVDALAPLPWLAALSDRKEDDPDLFLATLLIALVADEPIAWPAVTVLAFASGQPNTVKAHVVDSGLRFGRDGYLDALETALADVGHTQASADEVMGLAHAHAGNQDEDPTPTLVTRLHSPGAVDYVEIGATGPINWRALLGRTGHGGTAESK